MDIFEYAVSTIIKASVLSLIISISVDFYLFQGKKGTKREMRSVVATGSMLAFFAVYYMILNTGTGRWKGISDDLLRVQVLLGVLMVVSGTIFNVIGRFQLKGNWANHIKIYSNHSLVTGGMYSYVRHPLYSSIILMLYGGSIVYSNWLDALLVTFVFIPFMIYRAKQEEQLLAEEFPGYKEYQKQVGMLFPKVLRRNKHE